MEIEKHTYFIKINGKKYPHNFTELSDIVSFAKQFKNESVSFHKKNIFNKKIEEFYPTV